MEHITESPERYNLRKALTLMERDIKRLEDTGTHTLGQSTLKRQKIRTLPLSLDGNDSLMPRFFAPFKSPNFPEPTEEYVDREYNTSRITLSSEYGRLINIYFSTYIRRLMSDFPEIRQTWSSNQIGDYNFGDLYRSFEPEFGTLLIFHVVNGVKPHIKCIMHNDLEVDDDHLLRGEVLTIVRIMLGQLKQKVYVNDMVAPVLLFSLNRRHPRVIEAYFDGYELVIRYTKAYDFTFMNAAGFKIFAQWWVGNPVGDTSKRGIRA
ncbi:uncharacterized protein BO80DRAFT_387289 [Aspergillus ibericus CBS 121593]|uniref:Uncharacterized protein n=1 Tax=Aspergillus ibericus CBS 121593 TaxID=1448316 RepID=A0A395GS96_9EURO|nr:hypothetical protein BO80DRAFT_387289 [Aspergillus ibericus CBS 121593]RAK98450.1 hypothetical protein BO80DRAFT_387289 [Aspergillus ibericus CBS 121593]